MDDSALTQLRRLESTERLEPTFKTAFHLASSRARYALERRDWALAARTASREPVALSWDRFPWAEAVAMFARGMGGARRGDARMAASSSERLTTLDSVAQKAGEGLFARNIRVLRMELDAWRAYEGKETDSALALLQAAANLESSTPKHPVTPAPTIPATEWAGDMLLELARPSEALQRYQQTLTAYPNRFNSLAGAARAAQAAGQAALARQYYEKLLSVAGAESKRPAVAAARSFRPR
jgi:tetratricopeptide (TPR) repeat protein